MPRSTCWHASAAKLIRDGQGSATTRGYRSERQIKVLHRFLDSFEGKLATSKWAKLAKCSHDTAYRDIPGLIYRGALRKDPSGGRSTSYSLVVG